MKLNLNRNKRYAIPIMTHPGIELIEKTVKTAVTDGQTHADAIIALSENTPSDAATVIMDLTVEAEAFGAKLHFSENDVPSVAERLLHDRNEVENLRIPDTDTARIPEYLKANRLAAERINDRPVFAGCIGPYSLAGRLYDMSEMMMAIYVEPDLAKILLSKCSEFILKYNPQIQISEKSQTKRIEIADSRKTKRPKIDKRTTHNKRHSNALITV